MTAIPKYLRICPECRGLGGHAPTCPDMPADAEDEAVEVLTREEVADIRRNERDDR